jgi:hypothetical protein
MGRGEVIRADNYLNRAAEKTTTAAFAGDVVRSSETRGVPTGTTKKALLVASHGYGSQVASASDAMSGWVARKVIDAHGYIASFADSATKRFRRRAPSN